MATEPLPLVVPLIHLKAKDLDERDHSYITHIRKQLANEPLYQEYIEYCTDALIIRFLVARSNVVATKDAIITALKWRKTRLPVKGILGRYNHIYPCTQTRNCTFMRDDALKSYKTFLYVY